VWAALRPSSVESRFEALRTATTPLVGRDEEMALLVRRWEQAKASEGQIVLVSGEPGIGKSRLNGLSVSSVMAASFSAGLVAFSHLQFSQIRGPPAHLFVRKIPYVI
jgi:hypothetical protein